MKILKESNQFEQLNKLQQVKMAGETASGSVKQLVAVWYC